MGNKLDCEIVRDLLPSYVDGLTGDVTNKALEEHLSGCGECSAALARMRDPEPQKFDPEAEVDYLKKVRRRGAMKSLAIGAALTLLALAIFSFSVFYVGTAADAGALACHVSVEENRVTVAGTLTSSGLGVSRVTFSENNGIVIVKVYTAPKTFFNRGEFTAAYTPLASVSQVRSDGLVLWEDGVEISSFSAQLFSAVNPYAGDMPSNSRIASILGVEEQFGPYTNELQTSQEPYGWTLLLEKPVSADKETIARSIMTADSCAMLAAVGNLGYVTWRYDAGAGRQELTVTVQDASDLAGRDIKSFSGSASELQELLQALSFKW